MSGDEVIQDLLGHERIGYEGVDDHSLERELIRLLQGSPSSDAFVPFDRLQQGAAVFGNRAFDPEGMDPAAVDESGNLDHIGRIQTAKR